MLVMKRSTGQRIRIGEEIWITVTEIGKENVRLGVDAPPMGKILREELIDERVPQRDGLASDAGR